MLNVNLSRQASKFLKKLPAKQARQIATKIMELRTNPNVHDSIQLKGYPEYRRTDIGEYRIIYNVGCNFFALYFYLSNFLQIVMLRNHKMSLLLGFYH